MLFVALTAVACIDTAAPTMDLPVRVAAITVQPAEATTNVGKRVPLNALALDPEGHELDDQDLIWTSADTSVAIVSDIGEVTARRIGSTVITATNGTKTGTATLTVLAPQVASVALSPATAALLVGDTVRFAAQPRDEEEQAITGRSVKWSIANPAIAKISGGVLIGLAAGTTVAIATVDGVSDSATVAVSARPVASVSVVPGIITLASGKRTLLGTSALDDLGNSIDDKIVTWSSDNEEVATVSSTGTVSALSTGTATITASVSTKGSNGKGKTGKGQVKVVTTAVPIATVTISPASATVITGSTKQLTAIAKDSGGTELGGRSIAWASGNSSVATVSSSGLVTAVAPGQATISASAEGKTGSSTITVTVPPVASLLVSPSSAELLVGKSVTLAATTLDSDGKTLTGRGISWSSSKSSIATVSSSGVVTGVAIGSAWVVASSEGKKDSASVTVTLPPVASVSVSPSSVSLDVGGTKALTVTLKDASGNTLSGRSVTWVSSDKAVTTVSSSGVVTAVGAGSATMTAASEGKSGTASIAVTAPEPPPTTSDPTPTPDSSTGEHGGYFVAPSGSGGSAGSSAAPWDLATALSGGNGKIQAGDTVWLRGGTYSGKFTSSLSGSSSAPIVVRQYPGERATVNGSISVNGNYTWYWGFEVANTNTGTQDVMGVDSHCPGCRFINLVIHDHSGNGLGMWAEGPNQEAYGNVIYNNGFHGSTSTTYGHGIYAQNVSGTKKLINNILVNQFGYGVHIYTEGSQMKNFTLDGNIAVNSGQGSGMDYQVGGLVPVENLTFTNNMSYRSPGRRGNTARLGYNWGPLNAGATITGNYLVGQMLLSHWSSITFQHNTVMGPDGPAVTLTLEDGQGMTTGSWDYNSYGDFSDVPFSIVAAGSGTGYSLSSWQQKTGFDRSSTASASRPTSTTVVVEPNAYEAGRANIIVYNWGGQGAVSVDLSKVLRAGDSYEVRNAQNFYASPVASGSYGGGSVSIPIGASPVAPSITGKSLSSTSSELAVFVVLRR